MRNGLPLLMSAMLVLTAACSKTPPENPRPDLAPVHVMVESKFALPVEIAVTAGGSLHRLGIVHPGMQADFLVPPAFVEGRSVEFTVAPQTRAVAYRSGPMLIAPGEVVDLHVAQVLFNCSTSIRP